MSRFTIYPVGPDATTIDLLAADAGSALELIRRYDIEEADVLRDRIYTFTLRLNSAGFWSIFKRREGMSMTGALVIVSTAGPRIPASGTGGRISALCASLTETAARDPGTAR